MKKNMKRWLCLAMAALLLLSFAACSTNTKEAAPSAAPTASDKLSQVKANGKLIMGCSADFPPYEFMDFTKSNDGEITGFDVMLANEICKDLGVELEIKDLPFDGLIAAMGSGQLDVVISGMNATEERKSAVLFSDEYYFPNQCVLIRKADEATLTSIESFSGKTVGAQTGSVQESVMNDQFVPAGAKDFAIQNVSNLVLELKTGKIDGLVLDLPIAEAYKSKNDDLAISSAAVEGDDSGFAVALPLGETELATEINKTLKRLKDEGKIEAFLEEAVELNSQQVSK